MPSHVDGVRLVSTGAPWLQSSSASPNTLFVRSCYAELYEQTKQLTDQGVDGVFVVGSPGIGKSCFLDYCLHRLREDEQRSVLYLSGPMDHAYIHRADGAMEAFELSYAIHNRLAENVDFILFDPHEDPSRTDMVNLRHFHGKKFIVAVSPDEENCKKLRKDSDDVSLYMGPVSISEALSMRGVCYVDISEDVVRERFAKLGGIPRDLFRLLVPSGRAGEDLSLCKRLAVQTKALEDAAENPCRIDSGEVTSQFKKLWCLYHLRPLTNPDGSTDYFGFTVDLCCEDARVRLRDQLMRKSVNDLWFAYSRTDERLGALRGIRFEAYAHKKIRTEGFRGNVVSLTGTGEGPSTRNINIPANQPVITLPSNDLAEHLMRTCNAARGTGAYLLPQLSNFPVADALCVPARADKGLLLQMKAGQSKPLEGDAATSLFNVSGKGDLVFVVPEEAVIRKKLPYSGRSPGPASLQQFRMVLRENTHSELVNCLYGIPRT